MNRENSQAGVVRLELVLPRALRLCQGRFLSACHVLTPHSFRYSREYFTVPVRSPLRLCRTHTGGPADYGQVFPKLTTSTLDQRYGKNRSARHLSKRAWWGIVAVLVVLAAVFVAWLAYGNSQAPSFKEVSFDDSRADAVTLDFELTKEPDQQVTCAVQALNDQHAIVGWKEITIGDVPADQLKNKTSTHRVSLRTTSQAHTATVDSCWKSS